MALLWRIATAGRYDPTDLSGQGAALEGARWNSQGTPMMYTSGTIALATLETLVHLGAELFPMSKYLVRVSVPDDIFDARLAAGKRAPPAWDAIPIALASQLWGDKWTASRGSLLCEVPSVIVPEEVNFLINPAHPGVRRIKAKVVRRFTYDERLRGRQRSGATA